MNEQIQKPFSWIICITAFAVSLAAGAVLNVGAGLGALALENQPLGAALGALPGTIMILVSRRLSQDGFSQGMLAGACIVALVGGMCGYGLGSGLNIH